mmetsp:Transcript_107202/g.268729  ORF Transcript_107202/g.268729 Transcript_107202/m.268729 type:complete len:326 (-) Transcript_107202:94-1071(-)
MIGFRCPNRWHLLARLRTTRRGSGIVVRLLLLLFLFLGSLLGGLFLRFFLLFDVLVHQFHDPPGELDLICEGQLHLGEHSLGTQLLDLGECGAAVVLVEDVLDEVLELNFLVAVLRHVLLAAVVPNDLGEDLRANPAAKEVQEFVRLGHVAWELLRGLRELLVGEAPEAELDGVGVGALRDQVVLDLRLDLGLRPQEDRVADLCQEDQQDGEPHHDEEGVDDPPDHWHQVLDDHGCLIIASAPSLYSQALDHLLVRAHVNVRQTSCPSVERSPNVVEPLGVLEEPQKVLFVGADFLSRLLVGLQLSLELVLAPSVQIHLVQLELA